MVGMRYLVTYVSNAREYTRTVTIEAYYIGEDGTTIDDDYPVLSFRAPVGEFKRGDIVRAIVQKED